MAFDRCQGEWNMSGQTFSVVIRGGTVALPQGVARADIGISGETIAAIGDKLGAGAVHKQFKRGATEMLKRIVDDRLPTPA